MMKDPDEDDFADVHEAKGKEYAYFEDQDGCQRTAVIEVPQ